MSDSTNLNVSIPKRNSTVLLVIIVISQIVGVISSVIRDVLSVSHVDPESKGKQSDNECHDSFKKAIDQLVLNPKLNALLVQSSDGCKLVISHGNKVSNEAWVLH